MRNFLVCLLAGGLAISTLSSVASAQDAGTGAVVGRVVYCGQVPRRVLEGGAELATDFSPEGVVQPQPAPVLDPSGVMPAVRVRTKVNGPAINVDVSVAGTALTAVTDGDGRFFLGGVPAAQPLTLQAGQASVSLPVVVRPNLIVGAGQTVDVGTLELGDCLRTLLPMGAVDAATDEQQIEPTTQPGEFQLAPPEVQPALVDGGSE